MRLYNDKIKANIDKLFNYCNILGEVSKSEVRVELLQVIKEEVKSSIYNAVILKSSLDITLAELDNILNPKEV